jgi:hypothetical protein
MATTDLKVNQESSEAVAVHQALMNRLQWRLSMNRRIDL